MKSLVLFVMCFLFIATNSYADMTQNGRTPREWDQSVSGARTRFSAGTDNSGNATVLTNIVATGNNATGNGGYIALMAVDNAGIARTYYLWVDASTSTGILKMASLPVVDAYTSFPWGDMRSSTGFGGGTKVSAQ